MGAGVVLSCEKATRCDSSNGGEEKKLVTCCGIFGIDVLRYQYNISLENLILKIFWHGCPLMHINGNRNKTIRKRLCKERDSGDDVLWVDVMPHNQIEVTHRPRSPRHA